MIIVGTLSSILALILLLLIVAYKYRGEIKLLLYIRLGWSFLEKADDTDIFEKVTPLHHTIILFFAQ